MKRTQTYPFIGAIVFLVAVGCLFQYKALETMYVLGETQRKVQENSEALDLAAAKHQ